MVSKNQGVSLGVAIVIGAGVGAAIGAATDNIGVWVAVGVAVGVAIGTAIASRGSTESDDDSGNDEQSNTPEECVCLHHQAEIVSHQEPFIDHNIHTQTDGQGIEKLCHSLYDESKSQGDSLLSIAGSH